MRKQLFLFLLFFCASTTLGAHSSTSHSLALAASRSAKASSSAMRPLVVIDAGHGGSDEGACIRQLQEKKLTLLTALIVKKNLEEKGYRVMMTRTKDVYISLPKRVSLANKSSAALFISIHFNSAKNTLAEGVEVFYYKEGGARTASSKKLAEEVLGGILEETRAISRGTKIGNFHVIRETKMPSVIVEAGFMTNQAEWLLLRKKSYLEKISKGIAKGVETYLQ